MASALVEAGANHRVEDIHMNVVDNRDRSARVRPGAYPPDHIFQVRDIDIVVDHDQVTRRMGEELRCDDPDLACVAVKHLLDSDDGQEVGRTRLRPIDASNSSDSGTLQQLPKVRRLNNTIAVRIVMRGSPGHAPIKIGSLR